VLLHQKNDTKLAEGLSKKKERKQLMMQNKDCKTSNVKKIGRNVREGFKKCNERKGFLIHQKKEKNSTNP